MKKHCLLILLLLVSGCAKEKATIVYQDTVVEFKFVPPVNGLGANQQGQVYIVGEKTSFAFGTYRDIGLIPIKGSKIKVVRIPSDFLFNERYGIIIEE